MLLEHLDGTFTPYAPGRPGWRRLVKAVVYAGYGTDPVLTQVADPDCPADGVVVAVGATGVRRSDWHAWKGHDPVTLPHIGGHEFAGVVATAFRAVTAHGRVRPGDWLAVHGCGGVGLSAVMIGAALGARVLAVDVSAAALARARELGAEAAVDAAGPDLTAAIGQLTGGGAHVSIDAFGSPAVAADSVRCLRRRGRHIQVGLLPDGPVPLPMDLVIARELEIYGSHGMAAREYPAMMRLVADGTLRPGRLLGEVITLGEVGRALAAMNGPAGAGMTVVRLAG
jgi:D-arabinose 1-dehydrogenase-like Zn-dependent alcohol dehydrogenase